MSSRPLVVDLDGTLLRSDLLVENALVFLRAQPLRSFSPFLWLLQGKAQLKSRLAAAATPDLTGLPYNAEVLSFLQEERKTGRTIVLATASHRSFAEEIANHLQVFDRVLATDESVNLSAGAKRDALLREYGEGGFDYMGNSRDDLPVWQAANRAYVVDPERGVERRARALGNVERVMRSDQSRLKAWLKALRLHQWAKNLLLVVPLLASHQLANPGHWLTALFAFLTFGLCASSVYVLNDLLDLQDDRHHPTKCKRPFASGALPIKAGVLVIPVLLLLAFGGAAWLLPWKFVVALATYYLLTLAYSVVLKRLVVVDVITLALLYTLRIVAGTFAFNVKLTFWMLAFSMFIFLSLALVKRYAELRSARNRGVKEKARGRGYYPDDLEMIASLGATSGYLSVLVLALYTQDAATMVMYRHPKVIWLACPLLLFWITRTWMLTHRGQMHDDPVVFAIKDRVSLLVGLLCGVVFWAAA